MTNTNWIYTTVELGLSGKEDLDAIMDSAKISEESVRMTFWLRHKQRIVNALRPFLDNGWLPTSKLDSTCLVVSLSTEHSEDSPLNSVSVHEHGWCLIAVSIPLRHK